MKKFASVTAYLKAVPPAQRVALRQLRRTIKAAAPQATEGISYRMPCFKHHGLLLCFAAFKDHCSLFMGTYITKAHRKALAAYDTSKGTIRFTPDRPLPSALVRRLVKARIAQNERKR
jgi:uncharacterized protein YdhG (YjbR/CyaY superfamily)